MPANLPGARNFVPEPATELDFVAIDDGGEFGYYPGASELLAGFEYPDQALAVLDRTGKLYRLVLGPDRALMMSGAHGRVDRAWLQQQWARAQRSFPLQHRVRRFHAGSLPALLAELFETLPLESHPDRFSAGAGGDVRDPFGHSYKVVRPGRRHPPKAPTLWYVEVERR